MKILIEIDDEEAEALTGLAESDMRSKTAMAKKLLSEAIRVATDPTGRAAHACGFQPVDDRP